MADDFVIIARYSDPIRAQMAVDVLRHEGIVATAPGVNHSGVLGAAGGILLDIALSVPAADATRAAELLEALEDGGELVDDDAPAELRYSEEEPAPPGGVGPYRGGRGELSTEAGKKPMVAAFAGMFLTFGAGHFYAGEKAAGALLAALELVGLVSSGGESGASVLLPVVIFFDIVTAPGAAKRTNAGAPRSPVEQLLRTAAWVVPLAALLYLLGGALDAHAPR